MSSLSDLFGPSRNNTWRAELLDLNYQSLGDLSFAPEFGMPGVQPGAQYDRATGSQLRESAKVTIVRGSGTEALDWTRYRIRLWYTGTGSDPQEPLATLIPTAAPMVDETTRIVEDVELHSTLSILAEDGPGGWYGVDAGTVGVDALAAILNAKIGAGRYLIDESDQVLTAGLTWDADTSWLTICNKIATTIGFFSLRPDAFGVVRAEEYVEPDKRGICWTFDDGPHTGLYMPGWTSDKEFLLPNRVVVIQRVEGDAVPLQGEALLPDTHPRSAAQIGRTITKTYTDQDFATQEIGDSLAARYLAGQTPSETRTIEHPWLPGVEPPNVALHRRQGWPDMMGLVQSQSVKLDTGGLFKTVLRGLL